MENGSKKEETGKRNQEIGNRIKGQVLRIRDKRNRK